jgi:hypothetical protein
MNAWQLQEMEGIDLGDERLNERAAQLLGQLATKPSQSIPTACGGWAETQAAYRFFDNPKVSVEKILQPHQCSTQQRMAKHPVVILLHDTTELDYTGRPHTKGIGPLANGPCRGMLLHLTLAVTPERQAVGVLKGTFWARDENDPNKTKRRKQEPIENKESYRWVESYRLAARCASQMPQTRMVSVTDREGDIYEIFVEAAHFSQPGRADFIVRASRDRILRDKTKEGKSGKLWAKLGAAPLLGEVEFAMATAPNRTARTVRQTVQALRVSLKPPQRKGMRLPEVRVNAVYLREIDPPKGQDPVEWLLLTSLPIDNFQQAQQVAQWYLCRWPIELFFKTLKSGCGVEDRQLETAQRLERCLALYLIIAWRILYLVWLGRTEPDLSCAAVFSEAEWKSVWRVVTGRPLPARPPPLQEFLRILSRLGGHLNRKNDGEAGVKRMWIALQRMRDFALAWAQFKA